MNLLIKGLKMPTSCLKGGCPVDGFFCQLWEDKYWSSVESPEKMRHRDCPLIELPDHGDLIDRDALLEHGCYVPLPLGNLPVIYMSYVKGAPVVIPAERSEDATD